MNKKTSNHELSTPLPHREGQGEGLLGGSAMDRQIPVSEQRRRKLRRAAVAVAIAVAVLGAGAWLGTQMIPTLDRQAPMFTEADRGTIDVSVSATGRMVPAFEEIIVSPIRWQILEG